MLLAPAVRGDTGRGSARQHPSQARPSRRRRSSPYQVKSARLSRSAHTVAESAERRWSCRSGTSRPHCQQRPPKRQRLRRHHPLRSIPLRRVASLRRRSGGTYALPCRRSTLPRREGRCRRSPPRRSGLHAMTGTTGNYGRRGAAVGRVLRSAPPPGRIPDASNSLAAFSRCSEVNQRD